MLYSVDKGDFVTKLPHQKDYNKWIKNLSDMSYQAIVDELNKKIDNGDIHTSGWMPGHDWTGTVFQPIYEACNKNPNIAAQFFGLIVFKVFMDREEVWGFGRYNKNGVEVKSITYYKLENIPKI